MLFFLLTSSILTMYKLEDTFDTLHRMSECVSPRFDPCVRGSDTHQMFCGLLLDIPTNVCFTSLYGSSTSSNKLLPAAITSLPSLSQSRRKYGVTSETLWTFVFSLSQYNIRILVWKISLKNRWDVMTWYISFKESKRNQMWISDLG